VIEGRGEAVGVDTGMIRLPVGVLVADGDMEHTSVSEVVKAWVVVVVGDAGSYVYCWVKYLHGGMQGNKRVPNRSVNDSPECASHQRTSGAVNEACRRDGSIENCNRSIER